MNAPVPVNDLDRAIQALAKSPSAMPDLYRALQAGDANGEIWFLMPYQNELEGERLQLKEGMTLPFAVMNDEKGEIAMLFSSGERLDEGLEKGQVPPKTFLAGAMPAKQALEILGACGLRAIINRSCATGSITIGPDMMRDLANGEALKPAGTRGESRVRKSFSAIGAADYPTYLVQPLFEVLKQHAQFKAAWVFGPPKDAPDAGPLPRYYLGVLMEPRDDKVFLDFNIVAQTAAQKRCTVELSLMDESNPAEIAKLFRSARPFFVAAGYQPPAG